MAADLPATAINDIAQIQSHNGLEAAALFRALSGDYVSPHPSPPASPRAAPEGLPTAMSIAPVSQPLRRRGPVIVKSHQPTQSELEAMGMRVRDYGYNNPLPPLKAWRPPQRQPTPPGRKGLQREDTEPLISDSSQESQPWGTLQSKVTEPAFPESSGWPAPVAGPSRPPVVQTPTVTPNGSVRWPTGWPSLSRQSSHRVPQLSLRFDFPPAEVEHSPATPTSPVNQPPRRSRRLIRDSPHHLSRGRAPNPFTPETY
ncbi:hypothetical protein BKA70DRAFT_1217120 [Coprinopsis sp. MPI-PUGE-AT-0042]|nr:hypothetical protein BKA70DRAFT_1217120 [Coprinopsis sp. MPI-PUGE-AT-0042]